MDMPGPDVIFLSAGAFANMKRLRLLIVHNASFSGGPDYLPNNLRWLEWSNYPSPSLPPDFHPKKLAVLRLNFGSMVHLWDGFKVIISSIQFNLMFFFFLFNFLAS